MPDAAADAASPGERRITLVIANLGQGGAQKVLVGLANHWAAAGWHVTLVTIGTAHHSFYFEPAAAVHVVQLDLGARSSGLGRAFVNNLRRLVALRHVIRESKPDVVLSFLAATNITTLIATMRSGIPVIVSERGDPDDSSTLSTARRPLRALLYLGAIRLVVQTDHARDRFSGRVRRRSVVIPNPVAMPSGPLPASGRNVVGVGHLVGLKNFGMLLDAFARCVERQPGWRLLLWGEGAERARLEAQAERLGIAAHVRMPGRSARPGCWVGDTAIFVLSSRHEGFPNALLEAMAAGLPVIATDCPVGGPRSMITHDVDGLLVPEGDAETLSEALAELMAKPEKRRRLGEAAFESAKRYAAPVVLRRWTALLEEAIASRRPPLSLSDRRRSYGSSARA